MQMKNLFVFLFGLLMSSTMWAQQKTITGTISDKNLTIKNIDGDEFIKKYGFKCPLGVKGRNSDNKLYKEKIGWEVNQPLSIGLKKTYEWIKTQVDKS